MGGRKDKDGDRNDYLPLTIGLSGIGHVLIHLALAFDIGLLHRPWPSGFAVTSYHLAFSLRHWPFGIGHLALAIWHSPFGIGHLALAI